MSTNEGLSKGVRQNLWLIVLAVGLVFTGILALLLGTGSGEEEARAPRAGTPEEVRLRGLLESTPVAEIEAPGSETLALIEGYRERIALEPDDPDKPAWLLAMGTLYMTRFENYLEASRCYEEVILLHGDWEGARAAYPLLVECYEALGDHMGMIRVYEKMMAHFPDDTQEYLWAKDQLGL